MWSALLRPATHKKFRHGIKRVGTSQSATLATQNDMTTCLETFEKERFCSFPHRHGDASRKPETTPATQNGMTTCLETFEKERFCSFPHRHGDVSRKPETRDETCGRSKKSISCETSFNFDIFGTVSNRLECHKVPRLPRKTT